MTRHTTFSPILVVTPAVTAKQRINTTLAKYLPSFLPEQAIWLGEPDQVPSLEQLREMLYTLSYRLGPDEYRVCIIPQLDHAPPELSHTLLKTLEEPPDQTLILLTVDSTHGLLSTLISRCQIFTFSPDEQLQSKDINPNFVQAQNMVALLSQSSIYRLWSALPKAITQLQALTLLNQLTQVLLPQRLTTNGRQMLQVILQAISQLHSNAHVRLTIENSLLQLYVLAKASKNATKSSRA